MTGLFVVFSERLSRFHRQHPVRGISKCFAAFLKADDRTFWVIWPRVDIQNSFHLDDELGRRLTNTRCFYLPRLKLVFFHPFPDRHMAEALDQFQCHHPVGQKT